MANQTEATQTSEAKVASLDMVLENVERSITRTIFGTEKDAKGNITTTMSEMKKSKTDKDGKPLDKSHTKTFKFDFEGVSVETLVGLNMSTTTVFKKYYNDNLFNALDSDIMALPEVVEVKVLDLLSSKRTPASPEKARSKYIEASLKAGKTKVEILAEMKELLGMK